MQWAEDEKDHTVVYTPQEEDVNQGKLIPVVEVFGPTIQGEGVMIGEQTWFIRFGGCDFRCERCDSLHAVLPEQVKKNATYCREKEISHYIQDKFQEMGAYDQHQGVEWVTFSGGNPAIWPLGPLVQDLKAMGYRIAVETQGSIWNDWLRACDMVTISPKGPGMGEKFIPQQFSKFVAELDTYNNGTHDQNWCCKVVVFDQRDLEFAAEILEAWPETRDRMFLSVGNTQPPAPAKQDKVWTMGQIPTEVLRNQLLKSYEQIIGEVMADSRLAGVRILPQLHVLVWGNKQGV